MDPSGMVKTPAYEAALDFALHTHADLVDVVFPGFIHRNRACNSQIRPIHESGHIFCLLASFSVY